MPERAAVHLQSGRAAAPAPLRIRRAARLEVGKSWPEADGDIAEAIDFFEFYAREALRYAEPHPVVPMEGERNEMVYIPLGVGAVIPPWNFAGAIMIGMTAAAIVTGNTVVLKPSSDSAVIAAWFVDLLHEVGLPPGVVNFVPGSGSEIGDLIVGASADSLHLVHRLERSRPAHQRARGEDRSRDRSGSSASSPRWAARTRSSSPPMRTSTRRSKASRFRRSASKGRSARRVRARSSMRRSTTSSSSKLQKRVAKITVGDPARSVELHGPGRQRSALKSISEYIEKGKKEGRLITGRQARRRGRATSSSRPSSPTSIRKARIAQEEIFGPVLAVIKAKDFDDAMEIANNTEFGLTGSLYTSDETKIERARDDFFVGNLYFNRKSTGAFVGAHPFGGFNMSGTDSKAGGRDYLLLFMQAKTISRKV